MSQKRYSFLVWAAAVVAQYAASFPGFDIVSACRAYTQIGMALDGDNPCTMVEAVTQFSDYLN